MEPITRIVINQRQVMAVNNVDELDLPEIKKNYLKGLILNLF